MRILVISLSKISKAFLKTLKKSLESEAIIEIYSPNSSIENYTCVNSYGQLNGIYTHIFLGCKPQHVQDVAQNLPKIYDERTIFISVLAGTTTEKICTLFNTSKVFRVMPSLAFEFGNSFLAYNAHNIEENSMEEIKNLFGKNSLIKCKNDDEINYFTGIYGSGIGFVFEIMNAFFANSTSLFPEEDGRKIVLNLFENACVYMKRNPNLSFFEAVQNVASKGGTTEAGIEFFRKNGALNGIISDAISSAIAKSQNLAENLGKL